MDYLIIFIFGFVSGWLALRGVVLHRMRKIKQIFEEAEAKSVKSEILINFTRQGDQIYAYNAETEEFLVQGTTKVEIIELLQKRFPDISFRASAANLKEVNLE